MPTSIRDNLRIARRPSFIDLARTEFERLLAENLEELLLRADNRPAKLADKTAAYTINDFDGGVRGDATTAAFTVTLLTAVGRTDRRLTFIKIDSSGNVVTIDPAGSETINGASTHALSSQYSVVEIMSDGTNWLII